MGRGGAPANPAPPLRLRKSLISMLCCPSSYTVIHYGYYMMLWAITLCSGLVLNHLHILSTT